MEKYFNLFDLSQKVNYKTEILSGLTVALALIPEAVAFALIAGLSPLTGKKVQIKHLSKDCLALLKDAEEIIDINVMEDPTYKLVVDKI